jgi:hypothetical protein
MQTKAAFRLWDAAFILKISLNSQSFIKLRLLSLKYLIQ